MREKIISFIPALKYRWLTPFYDFVLKWIIGETRFKQQLVEQANIPNGNSVLDIGCGTATLTVMLKKYYPKAEITGLDIDPEVLEIARNKSQASGVNLNLIQGLSYELPFPDNAFDYVFSSMMLHHLTTDNKKRTLQEAKRVLRPGGLLYIADFGKPHNLPMSLVSRFTRLFEEVADNIDGLIPAIIGEAGFNQFSETSHYTTIFGTVVLYKAIK
jgi:ubiquinone/menaquinone biosynthesis C-methylase UbiE